MDNLGKTPPSSIEAERSILGAMILNPDSLEWCVENLNADIFYEGRHSKIFEWMSKLSKRGKVDLVLLNEAMRQGKVLDNVGGAGYLAALFNSVSYAENVRYYADILKDRASRRGIQRLARIAMDYSDTQEPTEVIEKIRAGIIDVERVRGNGHVDTSSIMPALEARRKAIDGGKLMYAASGLTDLDEMMRGGFPMGYPVAIKGIRGKGKTALLLQVLDSMADSGHRVLLISLEMKREDVWPRVIGSRLYRMWKVDKSFDYSCLWNTGRWIEGRDEIKAIENNTSNWFIDDPDSMAPGDVLQSISTHVRDHNVDVVAIDHLTLVEHPKGHTQQDKEGFVSRLRAMTKAKGIVMIWVLQQHDKDERAYYYTTALHDASVVMQVAMKKEPVNGITDASIELEKNRFGPWGRREFKFIGGVQTFERPGGGGYHVPRNKMDRPDEGRNNQGEGQGDRGVAAADRGDGQGDNTLEQHEDLIDGDIDFF